MAYPNDTTHTRASAVTSITGILPSHSSGDLLLFHVGKDTTTGGSFTTPTGYTLILEGTSTGTRHAIFYKVAGGSETAPSSGTTDSDEYFATMVSVPDIAASGFITTSNNSTGSANSLTSTALDTTGTNNCLVMYFYCGDNARQPTWAPGVMAIRADDGLVDSGVAWSFQKTGGTCPTSTINREAADDGQIASVAIESSASPIIPAIGKPTSTPATIVSYCDGLTTGPFSGGSVDPSGDISTVDSITFTYDSFDGAFSRRPFYYHNGLLSQHNNINNVSGGIWACTSIDLSGQRVCAHFSTQSGLYFGRLPTFNEGGVYFGLRSGTGYRIWHVTAVDTLPAPNNQHIAVVDVDDTTYRLEDINTFNSAAVDGIFFGSHNTVGSEQRVEIAVVAQLNEATLILGSSSRPGKIETFQEITDGSAILTVQNQTNQSSKGWISFQDLRIGNGTDPVYFEDSGGVLEFPKVRTESERRVSYNVGASVASITFEAVSGDTIKLNDYTITSETTYNFSIDSGSTSAATWDFAGLIIVNADIVLRDIFSTGASAITFRNCPTFTANSADLSGGCLFDNTRVTVTSETELQDIYNCEFKNRDGAGESAILITGNQTGTWSDPSITVSNNTFDIEYTGTTNFTIESAVSLSVNNSSSGVLTISTPTADLTLNSSESSTLLQIFTTATQTVISSTTGSSLVYTHSDETVDVVAQKAGFIPQRQTGIVLSGDVTITFNLVADPVYDSSHGLTYTTDASWSRANNELTVPTFGPTVRQVYSLMIDSFISETSLRNTPFNIFMNGPSSMFLIEDAEGATDGDIENMTDGGVRYVSVADATTAEWSGVQSIGTATGFTGEYQQVDGSGTTDARATGAFDEIIKVYGDSTHGNFDYRGHLVLKYQVNGYYQSRVDVLDAYGISSLEPTLYVIAMEPVLTGISTGDPAISITITDHTASPITVGGKSFDYEVVDNGTNTAEDILREINYNLSLDATYQGKDPFNYPDMVIEVGGNYETEYGRVEGQDTTTTFHGFYVSRSSTDHPGFTRFQSNDGTYYTPAVTADISITGMPTDGGSIRLQIHNETAKTASAWAATTAYSLGDKILRSTGLGSEQTGGLYMVCTVAGTSGASEPTWDVTVGNTTSDGTVTWTTYAILYYDADPGSSSYADSYTDLEEFSDGDTYRIRFSELNGGTSFKTYETTGIAGSSGFNVVVSVDSDSVYATNGVDGSSAAVTNKFSPDYANNEIDLDTNSDFSATEAFAYYCYELTTSEGMFNIWGAVTAIDAGNYRNNTSVFSLYFDETAGFVKQTDSARWFRDDDTRPARDPTTGGNGIEINWRNPVFTTVTGSGVTAQDKTDIIDGVHDKTVENGEKFIETTRLIRSAVAGESTVSGTTYTFRDAADSKTRITATVVNGERTSVTTDSS